MLLVFITILSPINFSLTLNNFIAQAESGVCIGCSPIPANQWHWPGHVMVDTTLTLENSPYYIPRIIFIDPGVTLTIESGVVIKFGPRYQSGWYTFPTRLLVNGRIIAQGTAENPIVFTSWKDDEYGGDTNGDGNATTPNFSDWGYIDTYDKATFDHVIMRYGGDSRGMLEFNNNAQVSNSEFSFAYHGIDVRSFTEPRKLIKISNSIFKNNIYGLFLHSGARLELFDNDIYDNVSGVGINKIYDSTEFAIANNNIYNNSHYGVINFTKTDASFINNWWGDDSGPYHPTLNPQGQGDKVSDHVLFEPWIGGEEELEPVILIPGIMGSWWLDGQWVLDPILHTYDQLYENLQIHGNYIKGETLFAFPYNWRDSNIVTARLLRDKINEVKSICECDKIDLVAHSMGGLVARYYIESDLYQGDVDQLIFIATPHIGATKTYLTWEAGELGVGYKNWLFERFFKQEAREYGYDSIYDYIHGIPIYSVQELLPIYNYLQNNKETGIIREYPNNYPINQFLEWLNEQENLDKLNDEVEIINIYGLINDSTVDNIRVVPQDPDQAPLWQHGYPDGYDDFFGDHGLILSDGDKTVPLRSSTAIQSDREKGLVIDHLSIVSYSSSDVIDALKGEWVEIVVEDMPNEYLIIQVYSPVDFMIIDPNANRLGKDFDNNQNINEIKGAFYTGFDVGVEFAVIPNPLEGTYQIQTQGNDTGIYTLSISYIDDENEIDQDITAGTTLDEIDNYQVNFDLTGEDFITINAIMTTDDLKADIEHYYDLGLIDNYGIKNSLLSKLDQAEKKIGKNKEKTFDSFINEVNAQKGKHVDEEVADALLESVNYIINNLN